MKVLLTISLFISLCFRMYSQNVQPDSTFEPKKYSTDFLVGEDNFNRYAYRIAIKYYKKAFEKDTTSSIIKMRLAQSFFRMRDMQDAEYWANLLLADNYEPTSEEIYFYIEILASNQHYDEAGYWYRQYMAKDTTIDSTRRSRMTNFLNNPSDENITKNAQVSPLNINSTSSDLGPIFHDKGLVFASGRRPSIDVKKVFKNDAVDYLKLYYAEYDSNNIYKEPKILDHALNSTYHQGPAVFYDNDSKIIYTQSSVIKRRFFGKKAGRSESGQVNLKLYMADFKDGKSANITPFEYNSNEFSTGHATVSKDGKKMIFSSNRPDAIGGSDLYICYRIGDHSWTPPTNLGPTVNTSGKELFPYLHGNILYFSSDGHKGKGGLDIYSINLINDIPQELTHLSYPINTSHDDFNFVTKYGRVGYFVTNRGNPLDDEIYLFQIVKEKMPLTMDAFAFDSEDSTYIQFPAIKIKDTIKNQLLVPADLIGDSTFNYVIEPKIAYHISVNKTGYFITDTIIYSGDSLSGKLTWAIPMVKIKPNVTIKINNIYYDFDKASLRDSSRIELNKIIKWLEDNPEVKLEIASHSDSRGNADYNLKLSQRRAESVVNYLVESGITNDRLIAQGYGETQPIIDCATQKCTRQDHQINRRTEMKVLTSAPESSLDETSDQQGDIESETQKEEKAIKEEPKQPATIED